MQMPTAQDFIAGRVTNPEQSEVVRKRLYDYLLYPTAGSMQLNFFAQAVGAGLTTAVGATAGTPKTALDTNLVLSNTLPSGQEFLIESIEIQFDPGSVSTANTYTPANVSLFAVAASAAVAGQLNDVNTLLQSGLVELKVLSKSYLTETPIRAFPPKVSMSGNYAISSNSATVGSSVIANAYASGRPYFLEPWITLQPAINFNFSITWPGLVATPSGFNGRIGVIFDGFEMRASQ
jgi:hypothetical protein